MDIKDEIIFGKPKNFQIKAHAKINLTLDILKKDASGYHHIRTILQEIDLHDTLIFKKISEPKILLTSTDKSLPLDAKNTVYQAVLVLQNYLGGLPSGIHITLKKNIPIASGLGGGSSDAAATLKALNIIWKLKLSKQKLQNLAKKIGMDVPFFLTGGTAYATHFGEKIHSLPALGNFYGLLIQVARKKSTKAMYRKIDAFQNGLQVAKTKQLLKLLCQPNRKKNELIEIEKYLHNDFNQIYSKQISNLKKQFHKFGAQSLSCTGSGPFLYAIFKTSHAQQNVLEYTENSIVRSPLQGSRQGQFIRIIKVSTRR